ncbi:Hypothetical predicted protein, partial [Pelobates cultripes]
MLRVWCSIRYSKRLTTSPNPLTPITNNPKLAGGLSPADLKNFGVTDWVHQPMAVLLQDRRPSLLDEFCYYQLKTYVATIT